MKHSKILFLLLSVVSCFTPVEGQVYKWIDQDGVANYSSIKPNEAATPAELPPIVREKATADPIKLSFSCSSHGGINCAAGPDQDGSVICLDGFRDALEIEKAQDHLSVWVRNEKQVEAVEVAIQMTLPTGKAIVAEGPSAIAPSELVEFTFKGIDLDQVYTLAQIQPTCRNCG
jgi:hypothetical protein